MIITTFDIDSADDIRRYIDAIDKNNSYYELQKKKLSSDYIWDEEESVRWNREKTTQWNSDIDTEIETLKRDKITSTQHLEKAIAQYIVNELLYYEGVPFTEQQALAVWKWCEYEHEYEAPQWLSAVIRLIVEVNSCG